MVSEVYWQLSAGKETCMFQTWFKDDRTEENEQGNVLLLGDRNEKTKKRRKRREKTCILLLL